MKKLKLDRIISIATLVASLVAIILVLKRPTPVAQPQTPAAIAEHAAADCLVVDPWNCWGAAQVFAYASELAVLAPTRPST